MRRAVIFDGDDTLWSTEGLYDAARAAARAVVSRAGLDGGRWEALQRELDLANVATLGHTPARFPASCVQALDLVSTACDETTRVALRHAVRGLAEAVFTTDAPLRDGAVAVLEELRRRGLRLALLTKGDVDVQERRVRSSGLAAHFAVVEIVPSKHAADFRRVVALLGLAAAEVISVGNSVRSDVLPSLAAGVDAVWIPAPVWEYERTHDGHHDVAAVPRITELGELLALVP